MFEVNLTNLLNPLVAGQVFWDTTPDAFVLTAPVIILQQVGGKAAWFVEKETPMPSHKNARIQVTIFSKSRIVTAPLARLVEDTIALSSFVSEVLGASVAIHDGDLKLYGSQQQFAFWYPDP